MARQLIQYRVNAIRTPSVNPKTLVQIIAPTNIRVVIHSVQINLLGSVGASAPLEFDIIRQTDNPAGWAAAYTPFTQLENPETVQTAVEEATADGGAEPTASGNPVDSFALHQQVPFLWTPGNPDRRIVIPGGQIYGIRALFTAVAVRLAVNLEE